MSEIEMRVTLNGTKAFGMRLLDFPETALPGVNGKLAKHFTRALDPAR